MVCAVILNTINLDFMTIKKKKKNHLRGNLKNTYLRFPMRFLSEKNILFSRCAYFCEHLWDPLEELRKSIGITQSNHTQKEQRETSMVIQDTLEISSSI